MVRIMKEKLLKWLGVIPEEESLAKTTKDLFSITPIDLDDPYSFRTDRSPNSPGGYFGGF